MYIWKYFCGSVLFIIIYESNKTGILLWNHPTPYFTQKRAIHQYGRLKQLVQSGNVRLHFAVCLPHAVHTQVIANMSLECVQLVLTARFLSSNVLIHREYYLLDFKLILSRVHQIVMYYSIIYIYTKFCWTAVASSLN